MTRNIWIGIVVVVVLVAGGWWYFNQSSAPTTSETTEFPMVQQNTTSGSQPVQQYSNSNTGVQPTTNPPAKPTPSPAPSTNESPSSKTYSNSQYGFSFQYPTSLSLETTGLSTGGLQGASTIGVVSTYVTMSNVIDRLTVNASSDPSDVSNCMVAPNSSDPTGEHASNVSTLNINGTSFLRYQLSDLAAGQSVNITAYHAVRNNTCYEMRDMVSSTASNRLSAEENQQQSANITAASAIIVPIVQSFRFN